MVIKYKAATVAATLLILAAGRDALLKNNLHDNTIPIVPSPYLVKATFVVKHLCLFDYLSGKSSCTFFLSRVKKISYKEPARPNMGNLSFVSL